MTKETMREDYSQTLQLVESKEPLPKGIIGILEGHHFDPGANSRNRRHYESNHWEHQFGKATIQEMMGRGGLVGTIGHVDEELESLARNDKITHRVLEIDPKSGYGKSGILDTGAGRTLKKLFEGGVLLSPSTKADGCYRGKTSEGVPIVDKDNFDLQRIDMVFRPGMKKAEDLRMVLESMNEDENGDFDAELVETLLESIPEGVTASSSVSPSQPGHEKDQNENFTHSLKEKRDMGTATEERSALVEQLQSQNSQITSLEQELSKVREAQESLMQENKTLKDEKNLNEIYGELGTPEEVTEAIKVATTSLEEIKGKVTVLETEISEYKDRGTIEELDKVLTSLKSYAELGQVEEIKEAFETFDTLLDEHKDIGTPEEIRETFEVFETLVSKLEDLGTIPEISELVDRSGLLVEQMKEKEITEKAENLAVELNANADTVKILLEKDLSEDQVRSVLSGQPIVEKDDSDDDDEDDEENEKKESFLSRKSVGLKLTEHFGGSVE